MMDEPRVEEDDRAWGGVLRGKIAQGRTPEQCSVAMVGLPLWGMVVEALGLRAESIWIRDERWRGRAAKWWPEADVLRHMHPWSQAKHWARVLVADAGVLPGPSAKFWGCSGVGLVLVLVRRGEVMPSPPVGWASRSRRVAHRLVGGATDGRWEVGAWSRQDVVDEPVWARQPPRVLRTLLSEVESGTPIRAPSKGPVTEEERVVELRPGVLAPWGLFPAGRKVAPLVVAPSVFSGTGFVRRTLTVAEQALLWDLPI